MSLPSPAFLAPETGEAANSAAGRKSVKGYTLDVSDAGSRLVFEADGQTITVTAEVITPEMAEHWLANYNLRNRRLQNPRVAVLDRDMEEDNWLFVGDSVRFATDANGAEFLADGQHRLAAIVKSRKSMLSLVVRGLHEDAMHVIDTGKPRSVGDDLRLDLNGGWTSENHVAAIGRHLLLWKRNIITGMESKGGGGGSALLSKTEQLAFIYKHADEIKASLKVVYAVTASGVAFASGASKLAAAWILFARKDVKSADAFLIEQVVRGLHLDHGQPAKALRDRLTRKDAFRPAPGEAFYLTLQAWNHYRRGTSVLRLQPPRGGWPKPEDFPIL